MRCSSAINTLALAALSFLPFTVAAADSNQGITREQADAILTELKQIRILLEKGARIPSVAPLPEPVQKGSLKFGSGNVLGAEDAPLTMVEFTDYQCGFCRQFHMTTFPDIRKKYIDTGKVRFITRDLPLESHANATLAAEAARCAGDQGQYWRMRDVLIANAAALAPENISNYAQGLYIDMPKFNTCLESHTHRADVLKEASEAASMKVEGTPTFLIGKSTRDGVEGVFLVGAQPLAVFEGKLKELEVQK